MIMFISSVLLEQINLFVHVFMIILFMVFTFCCHLVMEIQWMSKKNDLHVADVL
jgi:hypothetical protein